MIILSIPNLNDNYVTQKAKDYQNYWKEYRLDYSEDFKKFPSEIVDERTILTIRRTNEGGEYHIDLHDKIDFFIKIISQRHCLCDLEINEMNDLNISKIPADNLILSYHDFSEDINYDKLEKIINTSNSMSSKFLKIAVNITKYSDLIIISELISHSTKPVIFAGMGKLGKISRFLFRHLGAEATFIGLPDNPTASGQLTPQEAEILRLNTITEKTKIGGIIGGEQVEHSIGIRYYNNFFQLKELDAVYLPFASDDFEDLWNWIHKVNFNFYGFSITMPFKNFIGAKKLLSAVNLYLPKTGKMMNTDQTAFLQAIDILDIDKQDSVLIVGSGATAEVALTAFIDFDNVSLSCRNKKTGRNLAEKNNRNFTPSESLKNLKFNLIINCTPIGMNDEDFINETSIKNFKKVIDLPYQEDDTKLIDYCREKNIPFIDGKKFWKLQSKKQLEEFLKELSK